MRFLLLLCVAIYTYSVEISNLLPKIDPHPYSFEDKVYMLKKIGMEYCIAWALEDRESKEKASKGFSIHAFWIVHFSAKMNLNNEGEFFSNPVGEDGFRDFQKFIANNLKQYRIPIPIPTYSCLVLYDSKEYHDEVVRIVKKYCKDCK